MQDKNYKKLYRSRNDKVIAGVCGGLANFFNMDPVWMRVIFIIFFLLGGFTFILYIIMWIIVPLEPLPVTKKKSTKPRKKT